ncbi:hypothetical protein OsccyDRAFT_2412 [Leptolyngbyaceae cyanobacterium JSC-12]|nr:hypothetical protein OsccyDRAFT_2412 [Leptolyngbyaceae cyanobacterium JSC-12]
MEPLRSQLCSNSRTQAVVEQSTDPIETGAVTIRDNIVDAIANLCSTLNPTIN